MKFTEKEKKYLISAIKSRMNIIPNEIKDEQELVSDKNYQKLKSLIFKINYSETISGIYKSILTGAVREKFYDAIEERKEFYYNKTDLEILRINEKEKIDIEFITDIEILMNKLLPKDKKEALLGDYLKPYYELKELPYEESFYSMSGTKIYKIGIPVDKNIYINIELDLDYKIFPFTKNEILKWRGLFMFRGKNDDIINLFNHYAKKNKLTQRMEFVIEVLKKQNK